jgi:hypothetical protein
MVATAVCTIFAQPDAEDVRDQHDVIASHARQAVPQVEEMLPEAADDITAFADFPSRTGRRSGRPTRSSGSTKRSNDPQVDRLLARLGRSRRRPQRDLLEQRT